MLAMNCSIARPVVSYVIEKITRTLHRVGSVSLAVALAIALTPVGLAGPVAAQTDDPDDEDDDLVESIEALNTTSDEKQDSHNLTNAVDRINTSDGEERTLKGAIKRIGSDG